MALEYALAAGHDNEVSLDYITDIRISGRRLLSNVTGLGEFSPGLERVPLVGPVQDVGDAEWTWISQAMTPAEYKYICDTYLGGERSANVTVRTKTHMGVYANFNAVLTLPQRPSLDETGAFYNRVEWSFTQGIELP